MHRILYEMSIVKLPSVLGLAWITFLSLIYNSSVLGLKPLYFIYYIKTFEPKSIYSFMMFKQVHRLSAHGLL